MTGNEALNRTMLNRIQYVTPEACWPWTGVKSSYGYGILSTTRLTRKQTMIRAHRWAYEYFVGPIPEGLHIDHLCRNRACCNPAHLEPVTLGENVLRGDGLTARNARKTHCVNGHPLSGDNLYVTTRGSRECRTCERDAKRRRRQEDPEFAERDRERCRRWKKANGYKPPRRDESAVLGSSR